MKIRLAVLAALAAATVTALPAAAQSMKAGLWEVSSKMTTDSGKLEKAMADMQQQMASMPPEQRKMMEDMMSKQGVSMSGGAGGGVTAKTCITKEMIAQNQLPMQQHGDCTSTHTPVVGNSMKVTFQCSKPPSSGEGVVTFTSDSSYNMKMKMKSTEAGKAETMSVDANGKWLGANCGSIKPFVMPPAAAKAK